MDPPFIDGGFFDVFSWHDQRSASFFCKGNLMSRPIMDVNEAEYGEILRKRKMYRRYGENYKDILWAEAAMARLEKKQSRGDYSPEDWMDFNKAKAIYARVVHKSKSESNRETAENHTTEQYIWHTSGDDKVRPEHAANNGKIFSWNNPPATGHPGEDFGCRCWAEAYKEDELQVRSSQTVTFSEVDVLPAWTREDFFHHYNHGKGKMVRLSEIGYLQNIINHARGYDQGGGSIFERVEKDIFEKSHESGEGSFAYDFINSYEFQPAIYEIGGATVAGAGIRNVEDRGEFWMVTANVNYAFSDQFTRPYDIYDTGVWPLTLNTGTPYYITGGWSTRIDAIIRK